MRLSGISKACLSYKANTVCQQKHIVYVRYCAGQHPTQAPRPRGAWVRGYVRGNTSAVASNSGHK